MYYDAEIIQQINNSINIVDYVSQYFNLKESSGEYWINCPFHKDDINPSLSINKDKNVFYCFGCGCGGSIIQFVMHYHELSFPKAVEYLIQYGNLTITPKEYSNVLSLLHKMKYKQKEVKQINRQYLPDNYMDRYIKEPIKEWLTEGIKQEILDEYDVRYDKCGNRIVFPVRDSNGKIIAIKGRTLFNNHKDLGIPKYIYYQKIETNDFLFGLHKNLPYIQEKKEVIVFEGAKSVFFAEGYGYKNVVSLETSNINEYQIQLLLQLKTDVVFALDKGIKVATKKITNIKNNKNTYVNIGLLPKLTNVYVIEDKQGLLEDKDSPVDKGKEVWEKLYESRYKL